MSDTERREPDANENPYRRKNSHQPANQTTDEAAVDIVERLRASKQVYTGKGDGFSGINQINVDAADEIETLRAQLTATTRRAEQAERDRDTLLAWGCATYNAANGGGSITGSQLLTTIRSAASGEQG